MTKSATGHSSLTNSREAGKELGNQILLDLNGAHPDAVILFASSQHDFPELLKGIHESCHPAQLVGSSSAGEFTTRAYGEGSVSAVALISDEMKFHALIGRGLRENRDQAARDIIAGLQGFQKHDYSCKSILLITDALAGHAEDLVDQLNSQTGGTYQLFGGGAGDDANFTRTHVFYGTESVPDAAVGLEILSNKAIGVGVRHSWKPATPSMRVTEAEGMRLISLNNVPATEVFAEFAEKTNQKFDPEAPIPFFLHNTLGIATPTGFKLRVPLGILADGSVQCAADVPVGSMVHIMSPRGGSAMAAAKSALENLKGEQPEVALFFDCVATRLRMGKDFGFELEAVKQALGDAQYAGCNTYGQIARADGQFNGFHNCTAVVAILPK